MAAGSYLRPQDIGLLASVGLDAVQVFQPLTVAVLTTGDELREPEDGDLVSGEIYNSNRFSLAAQIRALGMNVLDMGNLPDQPQCIGDALERASRRRLREQRVACQWGKRITSVGRSRAGAR